MRHAPTTLPSVQNPSSPASIGGNKIRQTKLKKSALRKQRQRKSIEEKFNNSWEASKTATSGSKNSRTGTTKPRGDKDETKQPASVEERKAQTIKELKEDILALTETYNVLVGQAISKP